MLVLLGNVRLLDRVAEKFLRQAVNEEFQLVNFHCSHQIIIINFLLICWVMQLSLLGF